MSCVPQLLKQRNRRSQASTRSPARLAGVSPSNGLFCRVREAVQEHVQKLSEVLTQIVGVFQVLVVAGGPPHRVVMDEADPQPALTLVLREPALEPLELCLADKAMVILVW